MLSTTALIAICAGGGGGCLLCLLVIVCIVRCCGGCSSISKKRDQVASSSANLKESHQLQSVVSDGGSQLGTLNANAGAQRIAADLQPKPKVIDATAIDICRKSTTRLLGEAPAGLAEEEHKHRKNPLYETLSRAKAQAVRERREKEKKKDRLTGRQEI